MSNEHQNLHKTADAVPNSDGQEPANAPPAVLTVVPPATDENTAVALADVSVEAGTELAEMQPVSMQPAIDLHEAKRGLEAALLAELGDGPVRPLDRESRVVLADLREDNGAAAAACFRGVLKRATFRD